jgi:hypothetical protein
MTGIKTIVSEYEACVNPCDASLEKENRHMGVKSMVAAPSQADEYQMGWRI